jgi:hypothetical protein
MGTGVTLPEGFEETMAIPNAAERLREAREVGDRLLGAGIPLMDHPDHYAIFSEPPRLLAEPLRSLGYVVGSDNRCYPSPVDGCDYINVAASLPEVSPAREKGWPDHIAVVHPLDDTGYRRMMDQGYGNPFIHHITWGIRAPAEAPGDEAEFAGSLISRMVEIRERIRELLREDPGTLIMALPGRVAEAPGFQAQLAASLDGTPEDEYQVEVMEGGGYLLQFFVLTGGRIEVALRVGTRQTFNPKSVHKISKDELSVDQGRAAGSETM